MLLIIHSAFDITLPLFLLLFVVKGMEQDGVLHNLYRPIVNRWNWTGFVLSLAVISILFSNDVAVFMAMPIVLYARRNPGVAILAVSVVANVACTLFPWGNPQNLIIFRAYHLSFAAFLKYTRIIFITGSAVSWPLLFMIRQPLHPIAKHESKWAWGWMFSFSWLALSLAFHLVWWIMLLPLLPALILKRSVMKKVAWWLVILIFVITVVFQWAGRLLPIPTVSDPGVSGLGFITSQLISNVPAAALLVHHYPDFSPWLLLGVNAGGLGVPWASLANLIAIGHAKPGTRLKVGLFVSLGFFVGLAWLILTAWIFSFLGY